MGTKVGDWVRQRWQRHRSNTAEQYAYLSEHERTEVDRLREEHRFGNRAPSRDIPNRPGT